MSRSRQSLPHLKVNGETVEGFKPEKLEYNYNVTEENAGKLTVTAESEHEVTITQSENVTGDTLFWLRRPTPLMYPSEYVIHFNSQPEILVPFGKEKIKPVKVTASDIPEPLNGPEKHR